MKHQHHETITLPETVAHLADQPLCRIVAVWGMLSGQYLNRRRLVETFGMSPRKASYILRYVTRSPCIQCDTWIYTVPHSHRQELRVRVRTVSAPRPLPVTDAVKMPPGDRRSIWAQLLQRPWSELQF